VSLESIRSGEEDEDLKLETNEAAERRGFFQLRLSVSQYDREVLLLSVNRSMNCRTEKRRQRGRKWMSMGVDGRLRAGSCLRMYVAGLDAADERDGTLA
jgi:hypothetical protein